jgi:glycosyltransferase involved in cell wall biosynthesis
VRTVALLLPGRFDARTGGTIYDRRIVEGLRRLGRRVEVHELDGSFPRPTAGALDHAAGVLDALPDGAIAIVDSLALGAMPSLLERAAPRLVVVALMHLPLAADPALGADSAAAFAEAEGRALATARRVVVTGAATIGLLAGYTIDPDRLVLIEPGTDPAPLARGSVEGRVHLLSVATLNAGKGHEWLLRSLAAVPSNGWHLTCAGSLTRDAVTAARVFDTVRALGLEERVRFAGDLDAQALHTCYDAADVFVLASLGETYGMAAAEALARGLPVVSTRTGAIPALVGAEAGLLVEAGDEAAMTGALARVIGDTAFRARLAAGARAVRERLPAWDEAAARMAAVLRDLDQHG